MLEASKQLFKKANAVFLPAHPQRFPFWGHIPSDFVESWNGIVGLLVLISSGIYTVVVQIRRRHEEQRMDQELSKKNALDNYVQKIEVVCERVVKASTSRELMGLRRELNLINLEASVDYREERFRSSEDFTAFTTQVSFVLAQIVAKIQEIGMELDPSPEED